MVFNCLVFCLIKNKKCFSYQTHVNVTELLVDVRVTVLCVSFCALMRHLGKLFDIYLNEWGLLLRMSNLVYIASRFFPF